MLFQSSRGPNVCVDAARLPDLLQIQSPQGCQTILLPQGSSAPCTVDLPTFEECPKVSQLPLLRSLLSPLPILLSTVHVETSLDPGCTLTTKFSVRRAQDTNSLSVFFSGGGFPKPFVSTPRLDWLVLDLLRLPRPHPLSAQGTVANLTRLGRDRVADFAAVALAAMLDATVGSVSSTQPAVQRVVLDPFSRGPAVTFLTQASELSHVAAQKVFPTPINQCSATMFHRCMRSVRAQCLLDNK